MSYGCTDSASVSGWQSLVPAVEHAIDGVKYPLWKGAKSC
jgi:hypothetical protein